MLLKSINIRRFVPAVEKSIIECRFYLVINRMRMNRALDMCKLL